MALTDLGRFAEAMVTNAEALSIARGLQDAWREISSIGSLGQVCVAMAQWDVAARYYEQARALAEEKHEKFLELLMPLQPRRLLSATSRRSVWPARARTLSIK